MPGVLVPSPNFGTVPVKNSFYTMTGMVTLSDLIAYELVRNLLVDQALRQSGLVRTVRGRRNDTTEVGAFPGCARERC